MTLLTGTPHVDCFCPDGRVKPFCISLSWNSPACCCGGECCTAAVSRCCCRNENPQTTDHGRVRPCCAHGQGHPADAHNQAAPTPCKKKLAEADARAITPPAFARGQHQAVALLLPVPALELISTPPAAAECSLFWQSYRPPPPTDRVVAFHHFII
ncbi:MAG TPA: hypothetical protein VG013_20510 [Gemmataceae bacterium]|nr:hypothetical protein [Gemmataceae bacterium]